MVLLLKKMKFLDQKLIKCIIYSMILLKVVVRNRLIYFNVDVYTILNLQKWKIIKRFF